MRLSTLDDSPGSLSRSCIRTFLSISGSELECKFGMQCASLSAPIGTGPNPQRVHMAKSQGLDPVFWDALWVEWVGDLHLPSTGCRRIGTRPISIGLR